MQLFLSRGRTVAIYPGYKMSLEDLFKSVRELQTCRLRISNSWIFEIDFLRGSPVYAIALDPRGNTLFGDEALTRLVNIYEEIRGEVVVEVLSLTEAEVSLDGSYAPQSSVSRPELVASIAGSEVSSGIAAPTESRGEAPAESRGEAVVSVSMERETSLEVETLGFTELLQLMKRSRYVGEVMKSVEALAREYQRDLYLFCTDRSGEEVWIVISHTKVKVTKPIDVKKAMRCRVFIIE